MSLNKLAADHEGITGWVIHKEGIGNRAGRFLGIIVIPRYCNETISVSRRFGETIISRYRYYYDF